MSPIRITRTAVIPDAVRINRYRKVPELGPRLLFFSGGTALTGVSRVLKSYTHNSIHLVTPFDSGGSSAKLRDAFAMPSIGDLRSRLVALADEQITGQPEVYRLFSCRFPVDDPPAKLRARLDAMVAGKEPNVAAISNPMRRLIRNQIGYFRDAMPSGFDLRGASTGNLILAGGYLNNHQHLDPIIFLFSELVGVQGTVRAVVNDNLHLSAELADGTRVDGQHRLTGKEVAPITSPVSRLSLSRERDRYRPANARLRKKVKRLIAGADLICYPPGSFYSSLIANLLPQGVGRAIADNQSTKLFIPGLGDDPELVGESLGQRVATLLDYLRADVGADCDPRQLLDFVLIDSEQRRQLPAGDAERIAALGVTLIDTPLVDAKVAGRYDDERLVSALLSLT